MQHCQGENPRGKGYPTDENIQNSLRHYSPEGQVQLESDCHNGCSVVQFAEEAGLIS